MKHFVIAASVIVMCFAAIITAYLRHVAKNTLKNQDLNVKVNDIYLLSYDWETENPFEKIVIDTVIVTGVTDKYVKWGLTRWDTDTYMTCELSHFKHVIRPVSFKR